MRDVGRTREKVQNHEPEASGFEPVFLVFSQHPKWCLYKSTKTWQRVPYCFYKITNLPLCKNYLSKWSSSKLSRKLSNRALIQSESSTEVLTCIRGQVWIATRNIDSVRERNYTLPRMRLPRSDRKVSQSNYIVKSWESLSAEADATLLISVSCKHAADEINISFPAARRFGHAAKA